MIIKSFKVLGKVQGVMFRQTFIRGLIKRNLRGGATNMNDHQKTVNITIESDSKKLIENIIVEIMQLKVLNSWDATVEKITEIAPIQINDHEVTTDNVDDHKWSSGVDFYF